MLGDAIDGRKNNLDLIRLIAAVAVLVSHAWPITGGAGTSEPLQILTGTTLGTYAVMVFFGLSGFLITASFQRDPDPWRFCVRRARRLWPGLLVCLGLTVVCLGIFWGDLSLADYAGNDRVWTFLLTNGLMIGFQGDLPGVFESNPYPTVAGSIWTLQFEVACYGAVLMAGCAGVFGRRDVALLAIGGGIIAATAILVLQDDLPTRLIRLAEFSVPFAFGSLAWMFRAQLPLSLGLCAALLCGAAVAHGTVLEPMLVPAVVTYLTLFLGYAWPSGGRLPGDYSYGIYIYAFPVQGVVVQAFGAMDPWTNVLWALPPTCGLAMLSWHFIEQPCLMRSKRHIGLAKPKLFAK